MELNDRLEVLIQGCVLAQKSGVLSLDDAVAAKQAIDSIKSGNNLQESTDFLIQVALMAQKKGVYTLRDAHFLFLAADNIESCFVAAE